jgi:hypothetical protein
MGLLYLLTTEETEMRAKFRQMAHISHEGNPSPIDYRISSAETNISTAINLMRANCKQL